MIDMSLVIIVPADVRVSKGVTVPGVNIANQYLLQHMLLSELLTHCSLVMTYSVGDLGQHWFR